MYFNCFVVGQKGYVFMETQKISFGTSPVKSRALSRAKRVLKNINLDGMPRRQKLATTGNTRNNRVTPGCQTARYLQC